MANKNIIEIIIDGDYQAADSFDKTSKNLDEMGKDMQRVGGAVAAAGAAIMGSLLFMEKGAESLNHTIAKALTLIPLQGAEYKKMEQELTGLALNMSNKLNLSANSIAQGYYNVLSTGAQAGTKGFENMTEAALKLSKVTGVETGRSVEILSDTINAFSDTIENAEKYANLFFITSRLTTTTVGQLADAMKVAAPAAGALNVPLDETTVILAAMAEKGTKAAQAGTAFRIILTKLTAPTSEAKAALDSMGISVFDQNNKLRSLIDILREMQAATNEMSDAQKSATLKALVGEEAFSKLAAVLSTNMDKLEDWMTKLNSTTELQEALNNLNDSAAEKYEAMKNKLKNTSIILGNELLPRFSEMYEKVADIAVGVGHWAKENDQLADSLFNLSVLLLGAGGLLVGLGTLSRFIASIGKSLVHLNAVLGSTAGLIGAIGLGFLFTLDQANKRVRETREELALLDKSIKSTFAGAEELEIEPVIKDQADIEARLKALRDKLQFHKEEYQVTVGFAKDKSPVIEKMTRAEYESYLAKMLAVVIETGVIDIPVDLLVTPGKTTVESVDVDKVLDEIMGSTKQKPLDLPIKKSDVERDKEELISAFTNIAGGFDIVVDKAESPEVVGMMDDALDEWYESLRTYQNIFAGTFEAGFQRVLVSGNKWSDSINAMIRSMASGVISVISNMLAEAAAMWLASSIMGLIGGITRKAAMTTWLGPIGVFGQGGGTVVMAQGGGTITAGTRGVDNVPAMLGRRETVMSHDLTDMMEAFLKKQLEEGQPAQSQVIIQAGYITATQHETLKFGRESARAVNAHNHFVAKGSL